MLGNQSPSGLDINKHPSNCPFFFLIPPPPPGPAWTPTNNTTTMRAEQRCRLKKKNESQGGWIDSLALAAWAERKHACLGLFVCVGGWEIFTHLILFFFIFLSFQPLAVLPPGRGACRCWWWYNNTVRCLWPIPCHLDLCVNHHVFFSPFLFYLLSLFHRLIFLFSSQGVIFFLLKLPFLMASHEVMLYGYWWELFCVNATLLLAQLVNTT